MTINPELEAKKIKLQQRKNRLQAEEIRLKLHERKMRTRQLIELGGLVAKANLTHLNTATLYGAFLTLAQELQENDNIRNIWHKLGDDAFTQEKQFKTAVIVKFDASPDETIKKQIREYNLKYNRLREEWYGETTELESLKKLLTNIPHQFEIIS